MENRAQLIGAQEELEIRKENFPEFMRLFEESVLLALLEQGVLDDRQFQLCMDELAMQ